MFAHLYRRSLSLLMLLLVCSLPGMLVAQDLEQLLFTVGTVGRDSAGDDFGYIVLQSDASEAVIGRPYAVYEKAADFATASSFTLRAVVALQTNPQTIRSILNASQRIDADFALLESRIDGYFEDLDISAIGVSGDAPDLAEKVSFAVRSAQAKPELFDGLYFLGRLHPGMNVVLGLGYFGELNHSVQTWEIREWDPSSGQAEAVVGRVLLDLTVVDPALGYAPLSAPGVPVEVPFPESETVYSNDPRGHLNVRLRWHTPDALREDSLLALGYNVYRIRAQDAEALAWVNSGDFSCPAPSIQDVDMLLDGGILTQINVYPIMPEADLTEAEANDVSDTETFFTADDDDRFEVGAVDTFSDGDQFYYFTGTQDLLRRSGELSEGVLVRICDAQPPLPVDAVEVKNYFKASTDPDEIAAYGGEQHLEVRWRQLVSDNGASPTGYKYYVYRWESPQEMLEKSGNPASNLVGGPINHVLGEDWGSWVDRVDGMNLDSPTMPDDAGRTYFYSVRVEDASACGGNLSANSSPVFGVLRDRRPLDDATGAVTTRCLSVDISAKGTEFYSRGGNDYSAEPVLTLSISRTNPDIEWAEAEVKWGKDWINLGRRYFGEDGDVAIFSIQPADTTKDFLTKVFGGDRFGNLSNELIESRQDFDATSVTGVEFLYELEHIELLTTDVDCGPHIVVDRSFPGGRIVGPTVSIVPPEGAREYKLYRRINDGPLSLVAQGQSDDIFVDLADFDFEDFSIPNTPSYTVCYFIQVFDEHGNASALAPVSECIEFVREFPAPMLAQPELFLGASNEPKARLTWFCPAAGIDRFEVWVACNESTSTGSMGDDLEFMDTLGARFIEGDTQPYYVYQTRRVPSTFGQSAPEFSVDVELDPNKIYSVLVRAVAIAGSGDRMTGPFSNGQVMAWTFGDTSTGPNVAWPDRDLPGLLESSLEDSFNGPFGMEIILDEFNGPMPALRMGQFTLIDKELDEPITYDKDVQPVEGVTTFLMPNVDPIELTSHRIIGRSEAGADTLKSIFPFALYRYRVDAPVYRVQSHTVEQVSPLMREIAYEADVTYDIGKAGGDMITVARVRDPYFVSRAISPYDNSGPTHNFYLVDHSPLQLGGTYQYLMVFFTDRGEIETVYPLNQITIN